MQTNRGDEGASEQQTNLVSDARRLLRTLWDEVVGQAEGRDGPFPDLSIDSSLLISIRESVNSSTKTYRYVLPTQILAKATQASLDAHCVQMARGGPGAFDARSLCHSVIVPFDKANQNVLGGSPEPYVNNPLRQPEISLSHMGQQKNRQGWTHLCAVIDAVEDRSDPAFTSLILRQILIEIYRRLAQVSITYPAPMRISLAQCVALIDEYLASQSGGDRVQAVAAALFLAIGQHFSLYANVRRNVVNAADASSGQVADLECVSEEGSIVLAVEVKDRDLTVNQVQDKLPGLRAQKVTEILFIAQQGAAASEEAEIASLIEKEFVSGQNIYVFTLPEFARSVLALLGERGRRDFLELVGDQLDQYRSEIYHRRAWATLLGSI